MKKPKWFLPIMTMLVMIAGLAYAGGGQAGQSTPTAGPESWKPNRDFRIRIPFAAGGAFDTPTRMLAQELQKAYGRTVIVTNMPGANGAISAADLAQYPPEITEMMGGGIAMFVLAPLFDPQFPMKLNDYKFVSGLLSEEWIVCVNSAKSGLRSWQDLVAFGRNNRIICAINAPGGANHMLATAIFGENNLAFDSVHAGGDAQNILTLLAGDSHCAIVPESVAAQHVRAGGDIIPIMTFAEKSYTEYPGITVPTAKSQGMDIVLQIFNFFMTRAGVPQAHVDSVYKTMLTCYETDEFKDFKQKSNFKLDTSDGETVRRRVENSADFCKRIFDKYYSK